MPQHMKLVVNDLAARNPLLQAQPKRLPHVHAHRLDPFPLAASQLGAKVFIQRLLLALLPKPQRLRSFQIAHHRQKLVPLPLVQLVHPPCVATAASAGWPRTAPSTVDRCPVPCSVPDPSAAPPAAPRRSHRTAPPRPQTVCCRATCWATAAPSPPSLRTPGNPPDTVPPPPWFDTQSTADPGSLVHTPRASCAPVFRSPHRSCCDSPACA